ncbi:hypothetical protein WJX73_006394 [Symbiochloris irregularis]|uniref:Plasma membrane ATPase n=1 Tax=Symbiochloris irregularis TaxID=706552 RepID=A0AAW1NXX7_9CHLO
MLRSGGKFDKFENGGDVEEGNVQLNTYPSSTPIVLNGSHAESNGNHAAAQPPTDGKLREVDFAKVSISEALSVLKCTEHGLNSAEAHRRLEQYGPNKLPESKRNGYLIFLGYMWNPLSWAMEIAAIVAIALLDYADFFLILTLLFVNATISFAEEANADKAIKALTAALAPQARAMRDGRLQVIDAAGLVPGDVVLLAIGNIIAADVKLLGEEDPDDVLQVDQAALTGESLPAKKVAGHTAFSGSSIKQGEKHAVVYATGKDTFFGRAAALVGQQGSEPNLHKVMTRIGGMCLGTIALWCIIELSVQFGHYNHGCRGGEDGCPTLTNLLVVVVGGIPIAMPTVLTVTLALGAYKLAKEGAIVARMSAVEEMAGMDILCSDKTGTLTLNQLSIHEPSILTLGETSTQEALQMACLSANMTTGEAIDTVLVSSFPGNAKLWKEHTRTKYIPFNPVDKYTVAWVRHNASGQTMCLMKGAPQVVLSKAHNADDIYALVTGKCNELANRGLRSLGLARAIGDATDVKSAQWEFLAVLPLFDPPRHDTRDTVAKCLVKGIAVKMITGDQLAIGQETARQLGMGDGMHTSHELLEAAEGRLPEGVATLQELVEDADGFAEVFPEHKHEIVRLLQSGGHMVGMTGDGVNDAPALKKADVGIAVDGATDAARGAADIVLTKPGLSAIVSAIIGARKIFQRMTTFTKYTVAMTFRVCFTFGLLTVIYNWYFPTILIVLLAVFNDGAMIALSKDRVRASPLPDTWSLRNIFVSGITYGLYLTLSSWVLFHVATKTEFFPDHIHTFSLNNRAQDLRAYCSAFIEANNVDASLPVCRVEEYEFQDTCREGRLNPALTILDQCMTEQLYVRDSITRALMYIQVSVSGQALVFVVRTLKWSLAERAGGFIYIAFGIAQLATTLISALGFGGYSHPKGGFDQCVFCRLSNGKYPIAFAGIVPAADSEAEFTASLIGCEYFVVIAWIWSLLWYLALDPLKWALAWALNENGLRSSSTWRLDQEAARRQLGFNPEENVGPAGMGRAGWRNPLGRGGGTILLTPADMDRASVVMVRNIETGTYETFYEPVSYN